MKQFTDENVKIDKPVAVTIGKFDGLHRGHMALIEELKKVAARKNLATAVLTFSPHPMAFFTKTHMPLLLDPYEKAELFAKVGIDYYIRYKFDEVFASTPPEEFVERVLVNQLNAKTLVVTADYRFGKGGNGTVELAKKVGEQAGLDVHVIENVENYKNKKISSNLLRQLVADRDFALFSQLCGRPFTISGKADGQGVIAPHPDKILPPNGEYKTGLGIIEIKDGIIKTPKKNSENITIELY
ncbi:MAG: hypothetical protein FWB98_05150 [Defluviitaleaceae bacterium]|nr:hypothetical protein [Defluviitaleaceae bacterium]